MFQIISAQTNVTKVDTLLNMDYSSLNSKVFYEVDDADKLKFYINTSEKKYKMVYTFTDWCKPCREKFPTILNFQKDFKESLDVFYVTDIYKNSGYTSTENYLRSINNTSPVFAITNRDKNKNNKGKYVYLIYDVEKNKEKKSDRYDFFIQQLVPKHWFYGYSLIIIYDQNDQVIYASTYNETNGQVFDKIQSILGS